MNRRLLVLLTLAALVATLAPAAVSAARPHDTGAPPSARSEFRDGVVLVGFRAGTSPTAERAILGDVAGTRLATVGAGTRVVRVPQGRVEATIERLLRRPEVRYAEPDYIYRLAADPGDPSFGQLWGLVNAGQVVDGVSGTPDADIDADLAWDLTTGSAGVVVGVVDTGIDYTHPDLGPNVWSNPGGIGGCSAGTHGYDAVNGDCDPRDDNNHGSHTSGTIGAVGGNGVGVAGVNWTTSLMALKAFNAAGSATSSSILGAIDFAVAARQAGVNVRVLNNSWGGYEFSQATLDAIREAGDNDILFVAAAGNYGFPNDWLPFYPCGYDASNIICVAATDQNDARAYFSNYGTTSVDLGAPGVNILSTVAGGGYAYMDGTSMATPHVSGAAALVLALGDRPTAELKQAILSSVDPVPGLAGAVATGGRLNVAAALVASGSLPSSPALSAVAETGAVHLGWSVPAAGGSPISGYNVYRGTTPGGATLLASLGLQQAYDDAAVANGTTYYYQVSAVNGQGEGPRSNEVSATPPPPPTVPAAPALTALPGNGAVHLCWAPAADGGSPITAYRVYRGTASGGAAALADTGTTPGYQDGAVVNGVAYVYQVSARNAVGESARSAEAWATPSAAGTAPAIGGFAPTIAGPGTAVAITGTSFATGACSNGVLFGSQAATVTTVAASQIVATSPAAGGSGPITVTTPAGQAISAADFFAVPPGYSAADVAVATRMSAGTSLDVSLPTAGRIAIVLFAGTAGQRVSLNATNSTIATSFISILKPDGTALVSQARAAPNKYIDVQTLAVSGTYTILVDPEAANTGAIKLTLYNVPADLSGTIIPGGSAVTVTIGTPGQNARLTFAGTAGQAISLLVNGVTIAQSDVSILKPDGTNQVAPTYVTTSGKTIATTLSVTGTHTIFINPRLAYTGTMTLRL